LKSILFHSEESKMEMASLFLPLFLLVSSSFFFLSLSASGPRQHSRRREGRFPLPSPLLLPFLFLLISPSGFFFPPLLLMKNGREEFYLSHFLSLSFFFSPTYKECEGWGTPFFSPFFFPSLFSLPPKVAVAYPFLSFFFFSA